MTSAVTAAPKDQLNIELAALFDELSGISIANEGCTTTFMDLGFDSLCLTHATLEIQRRYGVKVTPRQMLEDVSSIDALSAYILPRLAPEAQARLNPVLITQGAPDTGPLLAIMAAQPTSPYVTVPAASLEALLQQLKTMTDLLQQHFQARANAQSVPTASVSQSYIAPATTQAAPEPPTQPAVELRTTSRFGQRHKTDQTSHTISTPEQQEFLESLIARYSAKTAGSRRYARQYRRRLADPCSASGSRPEWEDMIYSIAYERSSGSKLYDIDGNEYIDLFNGFGVTMFGHDPAFVVDAVKEQLGKGFVIGSHTPPAGETAELICELTGAERVTFCNTGSEAVMAAICAARIVTGRDRVVFFASDYHGQFDEVLVKGSRRGDDYTILPTASDIPRKNIENVTVLAYGAPDALAWIEKHAEEIAAVIVEPAQNGHSALQPGDFLHSLRDLTTRIGSAFVFDEVVTGFRVHSGGAQAYYGVKADMATYGEVAGGGLPIGILAGKARYMDAFDGAYWQFGDASHPEAGAILSAKTFVPHPLAIAAAHATLLHIKQAGSSLYDEMEAKSAAFAARLDAIFARAGLPVTLERCGGIMYFRFPQEAQFSSLFYFLLREKGVFCLEGFPLYLTTAHGAADLERVYRVFTESLAEMQAVGLLPGVPASLPEAPPEAPAEELTLTAAQLQIMLAAQAGEEPNCAFNESFSVFLEGQLREDHLRTAWNQLIARHESLRMHLNAAGDAMCIEPTAEILPEPLDLSSLSPEQQTIRIQEIVKAEGKTPFDLPSGPLVRAKLIRLAPERHQLIVTAHHIICDAWSINVLVDEWGRIYSSLVRGGQPDLLPVMRYSDYARESASASPEKSAAEDFWKAEFQSIPDLVDLPTDSPRRAERTFAGATHFEQFSPELTKAVRKAGAARGCTLFVTLLGIWQILLSRLSGQPEPVTLIPSPAQSRFDNCALVGHCAHLLPIRSQVQPHQSTASFLRGVKQRVLNAYEHQQVAYGAIVHSIHATAPAGRLPLSEVQFNLERLAGAVNFEGLKIRVRANGKQFVNLDIFLNIVESLDGLRLECDYNTDLYREETIVRWLDHYRTLLEAFAFNAQAETSALPLLNERLRQTLVFDRNNTESPYPDHASITDLIAQQSQSAPGSVAVEFYGRKLSRRQLEESADRVADVLRSNGIGAKHLVGLYIERSLDMLIALLGVLKSGAGYVPLDPLFPKKRIDAILRATEMSVVLTLEPHITELPDTNTPMITMESIRNSLPPEPGKAERPTADSTAYVIFTSGSTGTPKGVEITHRSVVNLLYAAANEIGFQAGDRLLAVTTLTFDIAALELLLPLVFGGTTVIARHQDSADGMRLLSLIKTSQCNTLQATPITWRMLLDSGFSSWPGFKMLCGGESWTRDLANRLLRGGGRLWNMYGPTETTIWSSISEVLPGEAPVLIGRPLANTHFYVLDEQMQPVPPGSAGELYIGGDGLARDYFNNPEMTSARFIRNPFAGDPHVRIYKTGDLVRQSIDGAIQFLRRNDHQVKLRGFRIELSEVERAIASCTLSRQVAVMLQTTPSGDPALVAYLVPQDAAEFDAEALRAALFLCLPEYMVPAWFIPLPAFPLTGNGKVDRKHLPMPEWQTVARNSETVAPSTPTQRLLPEIRPVVLGTHEIGIDDPPAASPPSTIVELPASEAQQRYWMLEQVQPEKETLHLRIPLHIHGDFNPGIARRALQLLVDRHEILRTTLFMDENGLRQRIHPMGAKLNLEVRDLRAHGLDMDDLSLSAKLLPHDAWNFGPEQQSWLHAFVILLSATDAILALTLSHTIADSWSCGILLREFYSAYDSLSQGEIPQFEPLVLQYSNVTLHEKEWLESSAMEGRLSWWRSHLPARLPPVAIPAESEHPGPAESGIAVFALDPMLAAAVRQFAQDSGVTLFAVYGAALLGLLARYTGQQALSLVTQFASRVAETEGIIGPFATPVLVHTPVPAGISCNALIDRFQKQAMAAFENALPLERCIESTSLQSRLGRHAANQISFFYQRAFVSSAKTGTFTAEPMPAAPAGAAFEWQFAVIDYETALRIEFQYDANLWSATSIQLCAEHYERFLSEAIFHPDKSISAIDVATEEERSLANTPEKLLPISRCALNLTIRAAEPLPEHAAVQ